MKLKSKQMFMDMAKRVAQESYATRLKVGAIIVDELGDSVISIGYNGTPPGWDNTCEYSDDTGKLITKPEVIHAEANCLAKLAKSNRSGNNSILFVTHSPCMECSKQIFTAGIKHVFYSESYRSDDGVNFLKKCNIHVEKI